MKYTITSWLGRIVEKSLGPGHYIQLLYPESTLLRELNSVTRTGNWKLQDRILYKTLANSSSCYCTPLPIKLVIDKAIFEPYEAAQNIKEYVKFGVKNNNQKWMKTISIDERMPFVER